MSRESQHPSEEEAAPSTARPPKEEEKKDGGGVSPQATAKIAPFQLAEALARLSAETGASSRPPANADDARATTRDVSLPTPLVEQVPAAITALLEQTRAPSLNPEPPAAAKDETNAPSPPVARPAGPPTAPTVQRTSWWMLVILVAGIVLIVYAYISGSR